MERGWAVFILLVFALPAQAAMQMYYIHNDHLGTPRVITNQSQQVVWKGHPKPFGETQVEVETITNHRRFPGQRMDIESRLHYNYFRDYDPTTGRFMQSDPIGLQGGINTYAYVGGNPVDFADSQGLAACYINFPHYPITIPGTNLITTRVGGHSGVLGYNSSGISRYYEYGRYSGGGEYGKIVGEQLPGDEGNVRRIPIPDLTIGPDGKPTPESLAELERALAKRAGDGTEPDLECDATADEQKTYDNMEDLAKNKDRPKYNWGLFNSHQCRDVARAAYSAGRSTNGWW